MAAVKERMWNLPIHQKPWRGGSKAFAIRVLNSCWHILATFKSTCWFWLHVCGLVRSQLLQLKGSSAWQIADTLAGICWCFSPMHWRTYSRITVGCANQVVIVGKELLVQRASKNSGLLIVAHDGSERALCRSVRICSNQTVSVAWTNSLESAFSLSQVLILCISSFMRFH